MHYNIKSSLKRSLDSNIRLRLRITHSTNEFWKIHAENMKSYDPEKYWTDVANRIKQRGKSNVIAGDDEPYYRYKRAKFLHLLNELNFSGQSVLEVGCGPGGNLNEIYRHTPKRLVGVDISDSMVKLARNNVIGEIEIIKINGTHLPFDDQSFDVVFTVTVLQHNTDERMLTGLMSEMARVGRNKVILFERIEKRFTGDATCVGRPVSYYSSILNKMSFEFISSKFIRIGASYFVSGAIRKLLNPGSRKEGEPLNKISLFLQSITLPVTKRLDNIIRVEKDLARLEYKRTHF